MRIGNTRPSHAQKSPTTLTRRAFGAHTAKLTPATPSIGANVRAELLPEPPVRSFVEEMEVDVAKRREKAIWIAAFPRRAVDVGDAKAIGQRQRRARQETRCTDRRGPRRRARAEWRVRRRAGIRRVRRSRRARERSLRARRRTPPGARREWRADARVRRPRDEGRRRRRASPRPPSSRRRRPPRRPVSRVPRTSARVFAAATGVFPFRLRVSSSAHSWNARASSDERVCVRNIYALEAAGTCRSTKSPSAASNYSANARLTRAAMTAPRLEPSAHHCREGRLP